LIETSELSNAVLASTGLNPLSMAFSFSPNPVSMCQPTIATFTIINPNNANVSGVSFSLNLPVNLKVHTSPAVDNRCGGAAQATAGSNLITLTGVGITSLQNCTLAVTLQANIPADYLLETNILSTQTLPSTVQSAVLTVSPLEGIFYVTNLSPSYTGVSGSLYKAILDATAYYSNTKPIPSIVFAIENVPERKITFLTTTASALIISRPVILDGWSQNDPEHNPTGCTPRGSYADPLVEISADAQNIMQYTLSISAADVTICGLRITGSNNIGSGAVRVLGDNAKLIGNALGVTSFGKAINGAYGVFVSGNNVQIGGDSPSERNYIAGKRNGVYVGSKSTADTASIIIKNNVFGMNSSLGATDTEFGVNILKSSYPYNILNTQISKNIFRLLKKDAVRISSDTPNNVFNNRISQNSIYGNGTSGIGLGINLANIDEAASTVTANDAGDADAGPNNLQNFPVISNPTYSGSNVTVPVDLGSFADGTFTLEFFGSTTKSASGYGEGEVYLGSATVNKSGSNSIFSPSVNNFSASKPWVTATATDATGNTSEFSEAKLATAGANTNIQLNIKLQRRLTNDFTHPSLQVRIKNSSCSALVTSGTLTGSSNAAGLATIALPANDYAALSDTTTYCVVMKADGFLAQSVNASNIKTAAVNFTNPSWIGDFFGDQKNKIQPADFSTLIAVKNLKATSAIITRIQDQIFRRAISADDLNTLKTNYQGFVAGSLVSPSVAVWP